MWIRSAFWIGTPKAGSEDQFVHAVNEVLLPLLKACPGVKDVLVLWPHDREDNPPVVACQIALFFEEKQHIAQMLASPERSAMRHSVPAIAALFDGHVSHINFEVV